MAGESSLCDKLQNTAVLRSLFKQKNELLFCDVIMKVCGNEIYAHSNVLAAASPYFQAFMRSDSPRPFSQRTPQVIEIQIDGSEPNMFYDEAVSAVVDFIYTGVMAVRDDNVAQIAEIAKIMQMEKVVKFCERYTLGTVKEGDLVLEDSPTKHDKCVNTIPLLGVSAIGNKMKGKRVKSMAIQVMPTMLKRHDDSMPETKDIGTSTEKWPQSRLDTVVRVPKRRGRPPKLKPKPVFLETIDTYPSAQITEVEVIQNEKDADQNEVDEEEVEEVTEVNEVEQDIDNVDTEPIRVTDEQIISLSEAQAADIEEQDISVETETQNDEDQDSSVSKTPQRSNSEQTPKKNTNKPETEKPTDEDTHTENEDVEFTVGRSARSGRIRKLPSKLRDTVTADPIDNIVGTEIEFILANERNVKKEPMDDAEMELSQENADQMVKDEHQKENKRARELSDTIGDDLDEPLQKRRRVTSYKKTHLGTEMVADVPPSMRRYSCDTCDFETKKVREMSNHRKLHKFEQNTCYYCDLKFNDREELTSHIEKHKGPQPFFCPTCHVRFKSRTMLNLHLPKHSNEKPFICEICSAGFKWKHALKGHMITHSGKKEHLCDICGYATAHKSQLKAHKLIHTGDLFKCEYPNCDFQATKRQNLKYHTLTHTREKPHQCEVCGQAFSLVKNMRRHMLLHGQEKQFRCNDCDFASTRFDKLKEHRLKQHGFGTAPEKRIRTADLVHQQLNQHIITPSKVKYEGEGAGEGEAVVVGGEEDVNAAVMLQALDEEHAMMQEIERHVAQSNVLFQMRDADPNQKDGATVLHLTEQGTIEGQQKLVTLQPDQVLAGNILGQQSSQLVLQPMLTQQQQQNLNLNEQIKTLTSEGLIAPDQQYVVANTPMAAGTSADGNTTYMVTADPATATYMAQPQGAYMTSDGTIVHLDAGTVLTTEDGQVIPHFATGEEEGDGGVVVGVGEGGQELVGDALTGEEVQYAEIMIQEGSGDVVQAYTESGEQISL